MLGHASMINTNHGWHIVPHRIHGVMSLVAVKCPIAFFVCQKLDLPHLAHRNIGGDLGPARSLGGWPAIGAAHDKLMTVQMNGMIGHGEITDTNTYLVILSNHQRIDAWEYTAIPRPEVEIQHGHDLGCIRTWINIVGIKQENEIAVNLVYQRMFSLGMCNPEPHHAHCHLRHFIRMGVIHESAGAARDKFINKSFTRRNRGLIQACHAIHAVRQALPMPVD